MNDKLEDSEDLCCPVLVHWIWPLPVDSLTHCVGGGARGAEEEEEEEDCASLTPVFPWQGLALRAVIAKEGRKRRVFESRPRSQLRHTEHKAATSSSLSRELGRPPMFNGKQGLP